MRNPVYTPFKHVVMREDIKYLFAGEYTVYEYKRGTEVDYVVYLVVNSGGTKSLRHHPTIATVYKFRFNNDADDLLFLHSVPPAYFFAGRKNSTCPKTPPLRIRQIFKEWRWLETWLIQRKLEELAGITE